MLYGPSYISFESALSYHGWIPEAVYMCTSASAKRTKLIDTPVGTFRYSHTPLKHFFMNVSRVTSEDTTFLIAEPWKAIGDIIYMAKKGWKSLQDLHLDLRVEIDTMEHSDLASLRHVAEHYDSAKVRHILTCFAKELG